MDNPTRTQQGVSLHNISLILPLRVCMFAVMLLCIAACETRQVTPPVLPTLASVDSIATDTYRATHAPPAEFEQITLTGIDDNLEALPGWRYELRFTVDGIFSGTDRPARYSNTLDVSYNQVRPARRVVATIDNDIQNETDALTYEAVQLGANAYLVQEDACQTGAAENARVAANLGAGDVLGGIDNATSAVQRAVLNGTEVYRYDFSADNIRFSTVTLTDDSTVQNLIGELWFSVEHNAIIRFYATMDVENVLLLDSNLPVSGVVQMRYDVFDIGIAPNLSIPFGC